VARIIITKITGKSLRFPDYPTGKIEGLTLIKIEGLTLTKCHDQELHNLAMLEEVVIGM
jgi:hypothetical protein